ncbi:MULTISPECIES: tyrosine-protein phosphatase [Neobacillus]|uniref:Tyrosine-protein phosphatase n=1 Tax=Neobacillus citreus TaxID=2833578 RepID=A0A942SV31_9BACI|nr:tyrosine-protein phosphatase [Neobacillus citreus]MCH6263946.1 tyrosine-protein phosphatase [Neobacillus citreus]
MKKNIMPECLLPLSGAVNFRDMGGLATKDGRKVKKGLFFRAAELTGLTDEDVSLLETLQLKRVFDYRRQKEAERKPDPPLGSAILERVSAISEENIATNMFVKDDGFNADYYRQFTVERFIKIYTEMPIQNPSYKRLMMLLKSPEENLPLVHHCTGGRDRTGVGAMLILMTMGVPYETVLEDYLLSNLTLAERHQTIFKKASQYFTPEEYKQLINAFPLREDYLHAAYNAILRNYGDFDTYIAEEFGISEEVRENIKNYCLE